MFRRIFTFGVALLFPVAGPAAIAQSSDDAVRVTVTMNADGSKTVYQTDGANRRSVATTTDADGKAQEKIIYRLDVDGRYESGQVFSPNGSLRFKTRYRYDSAGRLLEETQLAKDNSLRDRIVYSYDAAGHQTGYAIYDRKGKLMGRTTPKESAMKNGAARGNSSPPAP